jgi:hypothetical protein
MVKNPAALERFELEWIRTRQPDYLAAEVIAEALANEAASLGLPVRPDEFENLVSVLYLARAINSI